MFDEYTVNPLLIGDVLTWTLIFQFLPNIRTNFSNAICCLLSTVWFRWCSKWSILYQNYLQTKTVINCKKYELTFNKLQFIYSYVYLTPKVQYNQLFRKQNLTSEGRIHLVNFNYRMSTDVWSRSWYMVSSVPDQRFIPWSNVDFRILKMFHTFMTITGMPKGANEIPEQHSPQKSATWKLQRPKYKDIDCSVWKGVI